MFAKIFSQIFDSSIAEDWQVRCVFMDLLTLADIEGIVDMTPEAIARRTNVPIEIVIRGLETLQKPDPLSRSPEDDGRRIRLVDDHRPWGWLIINYKKYRQIASEEQRRHRNSERVARYRAKTQSGSSSVTPCNADVTPCNAPVMDVNACHAMQRQRQREVQHMDVVEEIYQEYPLKAGKPAARKAITAALGRGYETNWLKEKTIEYSLKVKGTDTIIPHPSTWFNQDRFNDAPETWIRQHPIGASNGKSVFELRAIKEAKEEKRSILKRRYSHDAAHGTVWDDQTKRKEYSTLTKEIEELNEKISSFK